MCKEVAVQIYMCFTFIVGMHDSSDGKSGSATARLMLAASFAFELAMTLEALLLIPHVHTPVFIKLSWVGLVQVGVMKLLFPT